MGVTSAYVADTVPSHDRTGEQFERDSPQPTDAVVAAVVYLLVGLAAIGLGSYLVYSVYYGGADGAVPLYASLRPFTLAVFIIAVIAYFAGVGSGHAFYPAVLFGLLLEGTLSLAYIVWFAGNQSAAGFAGNGLHAVMLGATGVLSLVFGLVAVAAGIVALLRGPVQQAPASSSFVRGGESLSPIEYKERARIKAHFKPTPKWPYLLVLGGLWLAAFTIAAGPEAISNFYASGGAVAGLQAAFLGAVYWLISDGGRTVRWYGPAAFIVGLNTVDSLQDCVSTSWLAPSGGVEYWSNTWPSLVWWELVLLGILSFVYAVIYRFGIYRRASDREMDRSIDQDMRPMVEHGLARLGVEPSRLITPALALRGVPDKDAVQNAFIGSRIGKDDVFRFTPQRTTVVGFTDDQVHFYEGTVDLTTGRIIYESVVEFFYQDISNVARVNGTQSIGLRQAWSLRQSLLSLFSRRRARRRERIMQLAVGDTVQFEGKDLFQINLESGRALVVVLRDDSFFDTSGKRIVGILRSLNPARASKPSAALYRSDAPSDENERVMRAIRTLIRDKKRALLKEHH